MSWWNALADVANTRTTSQREKSRKKGGDRGPLPTRGDLDRSLRFRTRTVNFERATRQLLYKEGNYASPPFPFLCLPPPLICPLSPPFSPYYRPSYSPSSR